MINCFSLSSIYSNLLSFSMNCWLNILFSNSNLSWNFYRYSFIYNFFVNNWFILNSLCVNWSRYYFLSNNWSLNNFLSNNWLRNKSLCNNWLRNDFSCYNWFRNQLLGLCNNRFRIKCLTCCTKFGLSHHSLCSSLSCSHTSCELTSCGSLTGGSLTCSSSALERAINNRITIHLEITRSKLSCKLFGCNGLTI